MQGRCLGRAFRAWEERQHVDGGFSLARASILAGFCVTASLARLFLNEERSRGQLAGRPWLLGVVLGLTVLTYLPASPLDPSVLGEPRSGSGPQDSA